MQQYVRTPSCQYSILNIIIMDSQPQPGSEGQEQALLSLSMFVYFIILLVFCSLYLRLNYVRKRIRKQKTSATKIDPTKIIVAIEIRDLLVSYSTRGSKGYFDLGQLPQMNSNWLSTLFYRVCGLGNYYKPLFAHQRIRDFISELNSMENVCLVLYTSLPGLVADRILERLRISKYFPTAMRRFCDLKNKDDQKHAIEVDRETRRVMIITPNREDHRHEFDQYFLIMKPSLDDDSFLKNWARKLKQFIGSIKDLSELHEKLSDFAMNNQSDDSAEESVDLV